MEEISRYHRIYKFENGATLVYFKHNLTNTTEFHVGFIGGSSQDKIPGTAHFLEHMILNELPEIKAEKLFKIFKDNNVISSAYTSQKLITFYANAPNTVLEQTFDLYGKLIRNNKFTKKSIDNERMAINEEILMSKDETSPPDWLEVAIKRIKKSDKKGENILGTKKTISHIDKNVLLEYKERVFCSENMVISVVSNYEFEHIKDLCEKYFVKDAISKKENAIKYKTTEYKPLKNYVSLITDPNQKTVEINVSFMQKRIERESTLFLHIETYLFNDFAGLLINELRVKRGLVYSANYKPIVLTNNLTLNNFNILTSKNKVNEALKVLSNIIKRVAQKGITQEQLDTCKKMIKISEEDRKTGLKYKDPYNNLIKYLEGVEVFYNNQLHKVKDLTLEEVNKYLKETYSDANGIIDIFGDLPQDYYDHYDLQKMMNFKNPEVYYDVATKEYYAYKNDEVIKKKDLKHILSGDNDYEKIGHIALLDEYSVNSEKEKSPQKNNILTENNLQALSNFSVEQKLALLSQVIKIIGLNVEVQLEIETENAKNKEENKKQTEESSTINLE